MSDLSVPPAPSTPTPDLGYCRGTNDSYRLGTGVGRTCNFRLTPRSVPRSVLWPTFTSKVRLRDTLPPLDSERVPPFTLPDPQRSLPSSRTSSRDPTPRVFSVVGHAAVPFLGSRTAP